MVLIKIYKAVKLIMQAIQNLFLDRECIYFGTMIIFERSDIIAINHS